MKYVYHDEILFQFFFQGSDFLGMFLSFLPDCFLHLLPKQKQVLGPFSTEGNACVNKILLKKIVLVED